ncbi:unnamed protein product [Mytilus edulis]|uniref:Uncharacterized protein n=1 Tax=Mytilus edulis TaxID=6550 RepID=A0A8S3RGU4_MYTED|nr:unnamed protein product [Mytilus edulis]
MAGKHYSSGGNGANILCLPKDPEWKRYANGLNSLTSRIFGLEMDILNNNQAFGSSSNAKNMPCAVCKTSRRSAVLMVPGRMTCHSGWHKEFSGYLVAQASRTGRTATEYICADENLESVPGGDRDDNEAVLYPVEVGAVLPLKCPPYVKGRELTCAVCSQ